VQTRDVATNGILKEIEAGRGSPLGGVYLSFAHCSETELRDAFGPVIDRLKANRIDLTKMPVEVAPIAHYHMGGIVADGEMQTDLPGLFAAGEAVGGGNGANRLSGNAVTEALVFGRRAGQCAARWAKRTAMPVVGKREAGAVLDLIASDPPSRANLNTAAMIEALQAAMSDNVGPLRNARRLELALRKIAELTAELGERPVGDAKAFDMHRLEWFDLRNMLLVARIVAEAALARTESRGAHQRADFPDMLPEWRRHQFVHRGHPRTSAAS
jgi:succinate dehydrogenase / fumarate reductase flavoprotein subunit